VWPHERAHVVVLNLLAVLPDLGDGGRRAVEEELDADVRVGDLGLRAHVLLAAIAVPVALEAVELPSHLVPVVRLVVDADHFAVPHGCTAKRSEEHTSELQSLRHLVCRLLLEKKKKITPHYVI